MQAAGELERPEGGSEEDAGYQKSQEDLGDRQQLVVGVEEKQAVAVAGVPEDVGY